MTNKEAIAYFKRHIDLYCVDGICREAEETAIKTLEQQPSDTVSRGAFEQVMWERDVAIGQLKELGYELGQKIEPCDDCINRQTLLDTISELNAISFYEAQEDSKECYYEIRQAVENIPPVTPQQKYGKWIDGKCNKCGTHAPFWSMATTYYCSDYCPKCGAKMQESEEI